MSSLQLLATGAALAASAVYVLGWVVFRPRDWKFAFRAVRMVRAIKAAARTQENPSEFWYKHLTNRPLDKAAMIFEGRTYTFGDLEEGSNRIANWALSRNVQKGDCVALYMTNCPEFVMVWLGMCKIGAVTALINHNLRHESLVHSVKVSKATAVIFGADLAGNVAESWDALSAGGRDAFCLARSAEERASALRDAPFAGSLHDELLEHTASPVPEECTASARGTLFSDPFLYVYTSGTTGLPKAAKINHFRFLGMSNGMPLFMGVRADDRVYCPLPLYHSAAGLLGVGVMFRTGCTLVLRRKFSASRFWDDVRESRATVVQYIGELCRYLVQQPPRDSDRDHSVRMAIGNGLRPDVWPEFQRRFGVPVIREFYGATEGAGALLNTENKVGACGFLTPLLSVFAQSVIVQFDRETETVVRDARGRCVVCKPGEEGEFIVKVNTFAKGVSNYSGYSDKRESQKKLMHNVFREGDTFFRSGDILRADSEGFVYFVDRIGDTFRWKGENVATTEVAQAVGVFSGETAEPNVYGVEVPGHDGRAGMVAFPRGDGGLADHASFDWRAFCAHVADALPAYARPVFVRVLAAPMDVTGTFKHKKSGLRAEGADPRAVADPLYVLDAAAGTYVPLTAALYDDICARRVRL